MSDKFVGSSLTDILKVESVEIDDHVIAVASTSKDFPDKSSVLELEKPKADLKSKSKEI